MCSKLQITVFLLLFFFWERLRTQKYWVRQKKCCQKVSESFLKICFQSINWIQIHTYSNTTKVTNNRYELARFLQLRRIIWFLPCLPITPDKNSWWFTIYGAIDSFDLYQIIFLVCRKIHMTKKGLFWLSQCWFA